MALIDISRTISPATAVWPGDQEVGWTWTQRRNQDPSTVNLGAIQLSTHTATHVDAPYHVSEDGPTTDELSLSSFVGPAEVVEVGADLSIGAEHVGSISTPRVLFKTRVSSLPDDEWPESVPHFTVEAIQQLNDAGAVLVGTDAPSVDPLDCTTLPAHRALIDAGIVNLEGLCLEGVSPGRYHLMALPLKITDGDAAPVRAVLSDDRAPG